MIYLDYAATTPIAPEVLEAMHPYMTDQFYNPSAEYSAAKKVKKYLEYARARIAHWLGAKPSEIIFTAGGTEANNLAIAGIMKHYPEGNIIVSSIEHEAVLAPSELIKHKTISVLPDGRVDISALRDLIDDNTVLVSIMYANNEIGTVQPIKLIGELLSEVRTSRKKSGSKIPIYFHTDASQATCYLDLHVSRLGVDLMTINGSKIYGPKQTGALYVRTGVKIVPQILGGGQERGLRSGTENVAGFVGLAAALDLVQTRRRSESERLKQLQQKFINELMAAIPSAIVNGSMKYRIPNNVHVTIPGQDNEKMMMKLDEEGIICASGSACSAADDEPSHVLSALGLNGDDIRASLRFTMGQSTDDKSVEKAVHVLARIVA